MATQTTKTYLQLVNEAIDEAGAELASFADDGSDFNTVSDAMMNRFKKWVKKAWKTIQQEQFDWEWMQSQAVVNLSPGIMFYGSVPITWDTSNMQPFEIRDVDDSTVVEDLDATRVVDLTGTYTNFKVFGYVDAEYADNTYDNQHPLDFGMKAGGEKLYSSTERYRLITRNINAELVPYLVPNTVITQLRWAGLNGLDASVTLTDGKIDNVIIEGEWVQIDFSYTSASDPWIQDIIAAAKASDQTINAWELNVALTVQGIVPEIIATVIPKGSVQENTINRGGITPLSYVSTLYGSQVTLSTSTPPPPGTAINPDVNAPWTVSSSSSTPSGEIAEMNAVVDQVIPGNPDGYLKLTFESDGDVVNSPDPYSTAFCQLLMLVSPGMSPTHDKVNYAAFIPQTGATVTIAVDESSVNWDVELTPRIVDNYYVHSWKSYSWDEEISGNDFVEDVREVDQSSFTLIRHQDPAVTDELPLQFIPWSSFENRFDKASLLPGQPTLVTEDPTGRWRFYPALDRKYTVKFRYGRQPQDLVEWDDVPKGLPEEWEDLILWRAVQYYGEYDEQPSVANRARGNYKNLLLRFQRQTRPKFYFKAKQLY